jgi:hypothetical protein
VTSIPAICESCGALFVSHNPTGGARTTTGDGERVGPCPTCGARWGRVIDGTHELADELTGYLGRPEIGAEGLGQLQGLVESVRDGKAQPEAVADEIRQKVPEAAGIASLLSARGATLETWLGLLAGIIALLRAQGDDAESTPVTPEQIEQVVHDVEGTEPEDVSAAATGPAVSTKVARNGPCPCGSGAKYKHCHGRDQAVSATG